MILELLMARIAAAVLKNTRFGPAIAAVKRVLGVRAAFSGAVSAVGCILSRTDCRDLAVAGLDVLSEPLTDRLFDQLVTIGRTTSEIEFGDRGIHLASDLSGKVSLTDPGLDEYVALARLPTATETERPSVVVAAFHDWRGERLERFGRHDEAIRHLLQGLGHKDERFKRAAEIRTGQGLHHDALRYYVAAIREGWHTWDKYQDLARCLERLGKYEDALELYSMQWARLGHHEEVYKQYRKYRRANPGLRLSEDRFKHLVQGMAYVCENWPHGTYHVTGDEVAVIERELASLENGRGHPF